MTSKKADEHSHTVVNKWWPLLHRSIGVQVVCALLMQVSYVAFPAYNFAIALWCLVCCTPKWYSKHPRLPVLVLGALVLTLVTDTIWISLWISGRVFYDQLCGSHGVSLVSCGGASDYFPGCTSNRFALVAMLSNDLAKVVSAVGMYKVHTLQSHNKKSGSESSVTPQTTSTPPPVPAPAAAEAIRSGDFHHLSAMTEATPNDH